MPLNDAEQGIGPVSLPNVERLPVSTWPDGFVLFGGTEAALAQIVLTPANGLVLVGNSPHYASPAGPVTLNRPATAAHACCPAGA